MSAVRPVLRRSAPGAARPGVACAIALALAGCTIPASAPAPEDVEPGEVRFDLAPGGAAVVVPVRLNERGPYPFILDTGATLTCVDSALAKELSLPARPGVRGVGSSLRGTGPVGLVTVEVLEVGSAREERCA